MNGIKNKVTLIGNLGKDPILKETEGGHKMLRVSIATSETYKNNKGEKVKETMWHELIAWGKTAEVMEKYLHKGSEVVIEGKLINNNYTDKAGVKKFSTEVLVNDFLMVGSKKEEVS